MPRNAEVRTNRPADAAITLPLLRMLAGSAFQKAAGTRTLWLAANLNAPEIDGTGADVRHLVTRSLAFVPVTDRLPSPLVEGNLLTEIQLAVDRREKP